MNKLQALKEADLEGKKIFLRLDLDVPIENGQIVDDSRLLASMDSLNYILSNWGNVIIAGHLGRPVGVYLKYTLEPVARWFAEKLQGTLEKGRIGEFEGWKIKDNFFVLENLRFFEGEEKNDPFFSQKLASLAEIYVNDAFAVSHRAHASIVGVPKILPHYAGLNLEKEIENLGKVLENPTRPLTIIIGGAKIETKLPLVKKMLTFADSVLVGGAIALELKTKMTENPSEFGEIKAKLITAELNSDKKDNQ